jgi:hypothetical protein
MREEAYIAIGDDGYVTLYWGNGSEPEKYVILRGRRAQSGPDLVDAILELKTWAEDNGYIVIVPAYDLEAPDVAIEVDEEEVENINLDEVDDLLDDLWYASDYENNGDE